MNTAPGSLPSLPSLYWSDFTIRYAIHAVAFGLLAAFGIKWATQPPPVATGSQAPVDLSFEVAMSHWVFLGGLVLSGLGAVVLILRYVQVRKVLSQGTTIKAMVEELDVRSTEITDDNRHAGDKPTYRRTYFATLRYTSQGAERKVRVKLPNSGFVYGLAKGRETDIVVLPSATGKPLIRSVYMGRSS